MKQRISYWIQEVSWVVVNFVLRLAGIRRTRYTLEGLRKLAEEIRAILDKEMPRTYELYDLERRNTAAAAIAKRLSEGVVYQGPARKQLEWPVLSDDEVRRLQAAMKELEYGQLVEVTVKIVEGTKDEAEDSTGHRKA